MSSLRIEPTMTIYGHALYTAVEWCRTSGQGKWLSSTVHCEQQSVQCQEPKTGQQKVQLYYEDDPLCPSSFIIYLCSLWSKLLFLMINIKTHIFLIEPCMLIEKKLNMYRCDSLVIAVASSRIFIIFPVTGVAILQRILPVRPDILFKTLSQEMLFNPRWRNYFVQCSVLN